MKYDLTINSPKCHWPKKEGSQPKWPNPRYKRDLLILCTRRARIWVKSSTAPSRADPVVVFPLCRWCPAQETSQPHPHQSHWYRFHPFYVSISPVLRHKCQRRFSWASRKSARHAGSFDCLMTSLIPITMGNGRGHGLTTVSFYNGDPHTNGIIAVHGLTEGRIYQCHLWVIWIQPDEHEHYSTLFKSCIKISRFEFDRRHLKSEQYASSDVQLSHTSTPMPIIHSFMWLFDSPMQFLKHIKRSVLNLLLNFNQPVLTWL